METVWVGRNSDMMKFQLALLLIAMILVDLTYSAPTAPPSENSSGLVGSRKFNRPGKGGKNAGGAGNGRPRRPRAMGPGGYGNGGFKKTTPLYQKNG